MSHWLKSVGSSACKSVAHWQKCDTETPHPAVGNLSGIGLVIVGLTWANPSASMCISHHTVASSFLLTFMGDCGGKSVFS